MSLCDLKLGQTVIINNISHNHKIKRRFYDLGFTEGAEIKLVMISPSKLIKGYLIRGSLIALRDSDARSIKVSDISA